MTAFSDSPLPWRSPRERKNVAASSESRYSSHHARKRHACIMEGLAYHRVEGSTSRLSDEQMLRQITLGWHEGRAGCGRGRCASGHISPRPIVEESGGPGELPSTAERAVPLASNPLTEKSTFGLRRSPRRGREAPSPRSPEAVDRGARPEATARHLTAAQARVFPPGMQVCAAANGDVGDDRRDWHESRW